MKRTRRGGEGVKRRTGERGKGRVGEKINGYKELRVFQNFAPQNSYSVIILGSGRGIQKNMGKIV